MEIKSAQPTLNAAYSIITGLFTFKPEEIRDELVWEHFVNWRERINGGDYTSTFNYLNNSYYDGYLNNIFPEMRFDEDQIHSIQSKVLNHLTLKRLTKDPGFLKNLSLEVNDKKSFQFDVEYIDLYLFPQHIGLFTLKIIPVSLEKWEFDDFTLFLSSIRQLDSPIRLPGEEQEISVRDLIGSQILDPVKIFESWENFNPQLKLFTIADLKGPISEEVLNQRLFEMGNLLPLGSSTGKSEHAPSETYFDRQMSENRITVFQNWSALALYDTFTRISVDLEDRFKSWEVEYFNLYLHTIFSKFFLYLTSSELSDVTSVNRNTVKIRDRFIEFINDYQHVQISYKFLPDLVRDRLIMALGIPSEVESMDRKIQRINEQFQEKRERSFNTALVVITLLSVFSVIYDLSEWSVRIGIERSKVYPLPSILGGLIIFILIYMAFKLRRK